MNWKCRACGETAQEELIYMLAWLEVLCKRCANWFIPIWTTLDRSWKRYRT